jgi:hypothetical protein
MAANNAYTLRTAVDCHTQATFYTSPQRGYPAACCCFRCTLLHLTLCPPLQCALWHSALQYLTPMHPEHTCSTLCRPPH